LGDLVRTSNNLTTILNAIALLLIPMSGVAAERTECVLDAARIAALLELPFAEFDQQEGSGWRPLYEDKCYPQAASLIVAYMERHPDLLEKQYILPFHAGQMFALNGQYDKAIAYMQKGYQTPAYTRPINWNAYATATIAFLRRDRAELVKQRELIDQQPPMRKSPGLPDSYIGKKMNLDVVDRFIACFDEPFSVAFLEGCEKATSAGNGTPGN
jgi:hypothetical protein